ncbi:MAG: mechanosensitive ion channel family protein [Bacteroidia bacterium]|jgi:MscS family membrane protein|nr:mechanosensitive ion channel family protein [Bacteroidia bacterium]
MELQFNQIMFLENSLINILWFVGIILTGLLFKRFVARVLSKQSFRIVKAFSQNQFGEVFVELLKKPIEQFLFIGVLYLAFHKLQFPNSWNIADVNEFGIRKVILVLWQIAFFITITRILLRSTDFFTYVLINRETLPISEQLGNFLKELMKVLVIVLSFFAALRMIFDVNLTALIASLGIGGLAVALAAQDTLSNLLGSFVIYLDKPFKVGDFIETTDIKGTVEHVGFRSTRIRTMEKSLLTVPNKKLIDTALNNITLSEARRVRFTLSLTYGSKSNQLLSIIDDIKNELSAHEKISNDFTVRFTDFDSSSLTILIIYFVMSNEYDLMIKTKEEINLKIMQIIEQNGCEFAYPTQTIYVNRKSE